MYAAKQRGPAYTGSLPSRGANDRLPVALPGEDGYVAGDDDAPTGSLGAPRAVKNRVDHDFDVPPRERNAGTP